MYGLGQGIAQGLQMVNQGMVQADDIRTRRREMQMKEQQFNQQMQRGQMGIEKSGYELESLKMQLAELKRQKTVDDMHKAFDAFEKTNNVKYLNMAKKDNPDLAALSEKFGINSFISPSELSKEKIASLGIADEALEDPAKRIVFGIKRDGSYQVLDLMGMYATTGYLDKLDEDKLKAIENRAKEAKLKEAEIDLKTEELKLNDMEAFLKENPNATLADYKKSLEGDSKTAIQQNAEYIGETMGEEAKQEYLRKQSGMQEKEYGAIAKKEYEIEQQEAIKQEAGVDNLYDVDVNKLSSRNRTIIRQQAKEEAKQTSIKDDLKSFASIEKAANRLDIDNLGETTGIIDASVKTALDVLGVDLADDVLVNTSNYALIVNAFTRATFGSQVTGNELERIKKQLGTEFRADKTVKIKLAETLENAAESFSTYKTSAPALYATEFKPRVDRLRELADYLREDAKTKEAGTKQELQTKEWEGKTYYLDVNDKTWKELK